jgi:hypothetical protein
MVQPSIASCEPELEINSKSNIFVCPHGITVCDDGLDTLCDASSIDLVPRPVIEGVVADLTTSCDQTFDITTTLRAPITKISSFVDLNLHNTKITDENATYYLPPKSDLGHIHLVRHEEDLTRIFHGTSIWSIRMDPPMSLSHARNKISEIACLSSFNSGYTLDFQFVLIRDYGLDKNFLVNKMCITCENFLL